MTAGRSFAEIEARVDQLATAESALPAVAELVGLGEEVLEHWITARGEAPTEGEREGFRLLALHRQGCKGDPSFNACRETCRELAYYYNLIAAHPADGETTRHLQMASLVAKHLCLFVAGKLQVAELGEFCCSSRPLRAQGG
ncbi:MAG: hypothetical protein ACR2PO_21120 [Methyloligellaceae bacterium]